MNQLLKQEHIDLWEIWIEYDPDHPQYFGTLYITGEIVAGNNRSVPSMVKCGDHHTSCLKVIIPPCKGNGPRRIKEIVYSEPIINLNQYTSVCIVSDNRIIKQFEEIEIMI
jgi:hypothetical protein